LTHSRAGLLLGMLGLLLCAPGLLALRNRRGARRIFAVVAIVSVMLIGQFALFGILQRLQEDPLGDARWRISSLTIGAARAAGPLGTGLGTFRPEFQRLEASDPGDLIINHAHNDFAEAWLEGGWLFLGCATVFLSVFAWAAFRAWRDREADGSMARACAVAVFLVLLHSLFDYPLRTTAIQVVFALLLAALLSRAARAVRDERARSVAVPPFEQPGMAVVHAKGSR
jgi:O-antigen ligase